MILYDIITGEAITTPVTLRPRTCFLMTKIGKDVPPMVNAIRKKLSPMLSKLGLKLIDADAITTGRDYYRKIWELIVSVPIGIAVLHKRMPSSTMGNVLLEFGIMQALGKSTIIIKEPGAKIPSDLKRTEYIQYDDEKFEDKMCDFLESALKQAEYFCLVAEQVERNPLLAIDYYRRAFLLTGKQKYCRRTDALINSGEIGIRAKNSVEYLGAEFRKAMYDSHSFADEVAATSTQRVHLHRG